MNYFSEPLWLEDAPKFIEEEYWCPDIANDDYLSVFEVYDLMITEKRKLKIFEPWEMLEYDAYGIYRKNIESELINSLYEDEV